MTVTDAFCNPLALAAYCAASARRRVIDFRWRMVNTGLPAPGELSVPAVCCAAEESPALLFFRNGTIVTVRNQAY